MHRLLQAADLDDEDAVRLQRFARLGVEPGRLVVTGNVKFDGLRTGAVAPGAELTRLVRAGSDPALDG